MKCEYLLSDKMILLTVLFFFRPKRNEVLYHEHWWRVGLYFKQHLDWDSSGLRPPSIAPVVECAAFYCSRCRMCSTLEMNPL